MQTIHVIMPPITSNQTGSSISTIAALIAPWKRLQNQADQPTQQTGKWGEVEVLKRDVFSHLNLVFQGVNSTVGVSSHYV